MKHTFKKKKTLWKHLKAPQDGSKELARFRKREKEMSQFVQNGFKNAPPSKKKKKTHHYHQKIQHRTN